MSLLTIDLNERGAALPGAKRELLRQRLRGRPERTEESGTPPVRGARSKAPLTSAQRRMWFFHAWQPASAVYNIPYAIRLKGPLNLAALRGAFDRIVARHEALRTRIEASDGVPFQVIDPATTVPVTEIDLSRDSQSAVNLPRLLAEEFRRPFDLEADRMLRVTLFRIGDDEHVLAVVIHHIASDLWSWGVLLRELQTAYAALQTGRAAEWPPLPLQYADYAAWEHESQAGPRLEPQLHYWKQKLAGAPALLELPADRPRPAVASFRGALERRPLPAALIEELKQLGRREDATLFVTLLAAFKVLLFRLTRQTDIVVGLPTAGRSQPRTEDMIGLFVNTLAVRSGISPDDSFLLLLRQVNVNTAEALSNQDLPFDKLIEELHPLRAPGAWPLVQAMFTLQPAVTDRLQLSGLDVTPVEVDPGTARLDLTLVAEERGDGLELLLEYNTDLFERGTAARFLERFAVLLHSIAADPHELVAKLPLLPAGERAQLLNEWNDTRRDGATEATLTERFEAQAAAHPRQEALVTPSARVTYGALNDRAEALAARLRLLGVRRETRVAIFLTRDADMVVALLAVLKAGGAYVAMDPAYPAERLAFMLEDSRAAVVVTQSKLRATLPPCTAAVVLVDEASVSNEAAFVAQPAPDKPRGNDLAYVIYTSGSTGRPKGVAIEHRNAVALVAWAGTVFDRRQLDGVLAGTSLCFDLSIFELFVPLSFGGKIILAENPLALPAHPAAREVRLINTVPSVMRELLRLGLPASVETVNLAGEPLAADLVDQLYALPQIRDVYDLYGPTETTVYSTFTRRERGARPTIGRPIANTELYIVDRHLELVPIGVTGELLIGGKGVARGYLDRPELTAERFIADPFSSHPEARLYRTGDLCRYRADGCVEYLGRADQQLKIRGFRVEPGEIESALRAHPAIAEAAVTAHERVPGDPELVAFVVWRDAAAGGDAAGLRDFLRARLPGPMIPSAFVPLAAIPRTANGKVNRAALLAEIAPAVGRTQERVAPRDPLEQRLVEIWEDVLATKPIGVNDRFFDLGGHSLLGLRLVSLIEKTLDCQLSISALFEAPSVAELAAWLRRRSQPAPHALLALQPKGSRPPLFLAHGMGGGNIWGYTNIARELGEEQPVYAFTPCDPAQVAAFPTIESMARHYVREMRRIQPKGPYHLGGYCFGGNVAYEMACQLEEEGESVGLLALLNAWPANAGHDRLDWNPVAALKFAGNVCYWATRWWQWPALTRRRFFSWKAETIKRRVRRWFRSGCAAGPDIDLLVDMSEVPVGERTLWQAHLQALDRYHPRPYGGKVTLLRTAGYPFFSSFDRAHGWRALARGGVEVRFVPGMHETLMLSPNVRALADELKRQLGDVSIAAAKASGPPIVAALAAERGLPAN